MSHHSVSSRERSEQIESYYSAFFWGIDPLTDDTSNQIGTSKEESGNNHNNEEASSVPQSAHQGEKKHEDGDDDAIERIVGPALPSSSSSLDTFFHHWIGVDADRGETPPCSPPGKLLRHLWDQYVASEMTPSMFCHQLLESVEGSAEGDKNSKAFSPRVLRESWWKRMLLLPVPLLHVVAEAFCEEYRMLVDSDSGRGDTAACSSRFSSVVLLLERCLRCPENHRPILFAKRYDPFLTVEVDEPVPYDENTDDRIKRSSRGSNCSSAVHSDVLRILMDTALRFPSCLRALHRILCVIAPSAPVNICDRTMSIWRRRISDLELALLFGVDHASSSGGVADESIPETSVVSPVAAFVMRLGEILHSSNSSGGGSAALQKESQNIAGDVQRRLVQFILRFAPPSTLYPPIKNYMASLSGPSPHYPHCTFLKNSLLSCAMSSILELLVDGGSNVASNAGELLTDIFVLLSRHPQVVLDAVFDPTPSSTTSQQQGASNTPRTTSERPFVSSSTTGLSTSSTFLDALVNFCAAAILANQQLLLSELCESVALQQQQQQQPSTAMSIVSVWASLRRIRGTSIALIDVANLCDMRQAEAVASSSSSLYNNNGRSSSNDTTGVSPVLHSLSDRLHHIADALDGLELSVCAVLERLDRDAARIGITEWIADESATIAEDIEQVLVSRGVGQKLILHTKVRTGGGVNEIATSDAPQTPPMSRSSTPCCGSSSYSSPVAGAPPAFQQPMVHLHVSDLVLLGQCWCVHQNEDSLIDVKGTYRVWNTHHQLVRLLLNFIFSFLDDDSQGDGSPLGGSAHANIVSLASPSHPCARAFRVFLFSFIVAEPDIRADHMLPLLRRLMEAASATAREVDSRRHRFLVIATMAAQVLSVMLRYWSACLDAELPCVDTDSTNMASSSTPPLRSPTDGHQTEYADKHSSSSVAWTSLTPEIATNLLDLLELWMNTWDASVLQGGYEHEMVTHAAYVTRKLQRSILHLFESVPSSLSVFDALRLSTVSSTSSSVTANNNNGNRCLPPSSTPRSSLCLISSNLVERCYFHYETLLSTTLYNLCSRVASQRGCGVAKDNSDEKLQKEVSVTELSEALLRGFSQRIVDVVNRKCVVSGVRVNSHHHNIGRMSVPVQLGQLRRFFKFVNHLTSWLRDDPSTSQHDESVQAFITVLCCAGGWQFSVHALQFLCEYAAEVTSWQLSAFEPATPDSSSLNGAASASPSKFDLTYVKSQCAALLVNSLATYLHCLAYCSAQDLCVVMRSHLSNWFHEHEDRFCACLTWLNRVDGLELVNQRHNAHAKRRNRLLQVASLLQALSSQIWNGCKDTSPLDVSYLRKGFVGSPSPSPSDRGGISGEKARKKSRLSLEHISLLFVKMIVNVIDEGCEQGKHRMDGASHQSELPMDKQRDDSNNVNDPLPEQTHQSQRSSAQYVLRITDYRSILLSMRERRRSCEGSALHVWLPRSLSAAEVVLLLRLLRSVERAAFSASAPDPHAHTLLSDAVLVLLRESIREDCSPSSLHALLSSLANWRSAMIHSVEPHVHLGEGQQHAPRCHSCFGARDRTWYQMLAPIVQGLHENMDFKEPRRCSLFDFPRAQIAVLRVTPSQFPTTEGFAISAWIKPGVVEQVTQKEDVVLPISTLGTMVLLGLHHSGGKKRMPSVQRSQSSSSSSSPTTFAVDTSMMQYSSFEIVLQHHSNSSHFMKRSNTGANDSLHSAVDDNDDTATSPSPVSRAATELSPPTTTAVSPTSYCKVFVRCADQQFSVCFQRSVVPYHSWSHLVVSASYDETMKLCRLSLFINGAFIEMIAITPPRLRPGVMLLGGGNSSSSRSIGGSMSDMQASPLASATDASKSNGTTNGVQQHPSSFDALYVGLLGPVVMWRSALTQQDVTFLFTTPQLDVVTDAPKYCQVHCMQSRRYACQWMPGKVDFEFRDVEMVPLPTSSDGGGGVALVHRGRGTGLPQMILHSMVDSCYALGGSACSVVPCLLALVPLDTVEAFEAAASTSLPGNNYNSHEDEESGARSKGQHATASRISPQVPVIKWNRAGGRESGRPPLHRVLDALMQHNRNGDNSPPALPSLIPHTTTADAAAESSSSSPYSSPINLLQLMPDLLYVTLRCCEGSRASDNMILLQVLALVLPSVPHLVSPAISEPIVRLLKASCTDAGYRPLFDTVLFQLVVRFELWSQCDADVQNELCMVFLNVLRSDVDVLRSVSSRADRVIPVLLEHVRSTLQRPSAEERSAHKALRRARVTAMDTASLVIPLDETLSRAMCESIAMSYVDFLRYVVDAAAASGGSDAIGRLSSCVTISSLPALENSAPFSQRTSSTNSSPTRGRGRGAVNRSPSPTPVGAMSSGGVYLYEVLMGMAAMLTRCRTHKLTGMIDALTVHGLQDLLVRAIVLGRKSSVVQRAALVCISALLHSVRGGVLVMDVAGKQVTLDLHSKEPFALAPLAMVLRDIDSLSPVVCTAVWELGTGGGTYCLGMKDSGHSETSIPESLVPKPPFPKSSMIHPPLLPLLVELLIDEITRRTVRAIQATASHTTSPVTSIPSPPRGRRLSASLSITQTLLRLITALQNSPTSELAETLLNPFTVRSVCKLSSAEFKDAASEEVILAPDNEQVAGGGMRTPPLPSALGNAPRLRLEELVSSLLGISCGRIVAKSHHVSWVVVWQCACAFACSEDTREGGDLSHESTAVAHGDSVSRHAYLSIAAMCTWAANEMTVQWSRCHLPTTSPLSAATASSAPTLATAPVLSSSIVPPESAAVIARRIVPLCLLVESFIANPYLAQDLAVDEGKGSACFTACVSMLRLIFSDVNVATCVLELTGDDVLTDEVEASIFGRVFQGKTVLSTVTTILRCTIVILREQPIDELLRALHVRNVEFPRSSSAPPVEQQEAQPSRDAAKPSVDAQRFVCECALKTLVFLCKSKRRATHSIFSSEGHRLPQSAAALLSEVCVTLSLSGLDSRRSSSQASLSNADAVMKVLCRLLHKGCSMFWDALERMIGESAAECISVWLSKRVDEHAFFSHLLHTNAWEVLRRALSVSAGQALEVPRQVNGTMVHCLRDGFERQARIDSVLWGRSTVSRGSSTSVPRGASMQTPSVHTLPTATAVHPTAMLPYSDMLNVSNGSLGIAPNPSLAEPPERGADAVLSPMATAVHGPYCSPPATSRTLPGCKSGATMPSSRLAKQLMGRIRRCNSPWMSWTRRTHEDECKASYEGMMWYRCRRWREILEVGMENHCPVVPAVVLSTTSQAPSPSCSAPVTPRPVLWDHACRGDNGSGGTRTLMQILDALPQPEDIIDEFTAPMDSTAGAGLGVQVLETQCVEFISGLVAWPAVLRILGDGKLLVDVIDLGDDESASQLTHDLTADEDRWLDDVVLRCPPVLAHMKPQPIRWWLSDIRDCVHGYRLRMRRTGMILRHQSGFAALVNFSDEETVQRVSNGIAKHFLLRGPQCVVPMQRSQRRWSAISSNVAAPHLSTSSRAATRLADDDVASLRKYEAYKLQQLWVHGGVTNFEYLMRLNTLAGRSVLDLSQYPIFPWVLADYTSEVLDLNRKASYRDFGWPISAQTDRQRGAVQSKYYEMRVMLQKQRVDRERLLEELRCREEDELRPDMASPERLMVSGPSGCDFDAYHNGTMYSSPSSVLHFLVRVEPYTSLHRALHDGRFDHKDRLFNSIRQSWDQGVFECVPELYYLPDMFLCDGGTLGVLEDVVLPPWARGSPWKFVAGMRAALEAPYVTERLPEWIDLVFGHRQSGDAAVQRLNTYHPMLSESWVEDHLSPKRRHQAASSGISSLSRDENTDTSNNEATAASTTARVDLDKEKEEEDTMATLARGMWDNMGQLPLTLFDEPHPTSKWITATPSALARTGKRSTIDHLTRTLRTATQVIEEHAAARENNKKQQYDGTTSRPRFATPPPPQHHHTPFGGEGSSATPRQGYSSEGASQVSSDTVVDFLPVASGNLYLLFDDGIVASTTWKGLPSMSPTDGTPTTEYYASFSQNAVPLCLLSTVSEQSLDGGRPILVLYSSTIKPTVLFLCSLAHEDLTPGRSPSVCPSLQAIAEDPLPDSSSPVTRAQVIRSFDRDVVVATRDDIVANRAEVGELIVTCQDNGAVTLWRYGDADAVHGGLTLVGRLFGHTTRVETCDANLYLDVVATISMVDTWSDAPLSSGRGEEETRSGEESGEYPWLILLHGLSTQHVICQIRIPSACSDGPRANVQDQSSSLSGTLNSQHALKSSKTEAILPSLVILHAPYAMVVVSCSNCLCCFNLNGVAIWRRSMSYPLMLQRVVDYTLFIASHASSWMFRDWLGGLDEFMTAAAAATSSSSRTSSFSPRRVAPTTSTSSSFSSSYGDRETLYVVRSVVCVDPRTRSSTGPSNTRAVVVSLMSNGVMSVFV